MYIALIIILVWLTGLICIPIMKKIEPDNVWYPVYAITVCVLFTIFVIVYVSFKNG